MNATFSPAMIRAAMIHKVRDALVLLRGNGWVLSSRRGSHRQFVHPTNPGRVTVAGKDSDDLAPKTWNSILRQAGLK
jgi:predicted RNA binding protein YcfA (HicA-like mRNA interferase family)